MEISALTLSALLMGMVDSSLGMMYGTILTPLLIGCGYSPLAVVPSILLSQALGGMSGTFSHHYHNNADFKGLSKHTKIVLAIALPGVIAAIGGVFISAFIPGTALKIYISLVVIIMSILCIRPVNFNFKWWKIYLVGIVSSFNKAVSGGGFGPLTSTANIASGLDSKTSVSITTYAEVPICLSSFLMYLFLRGLPGIKIIIPLCLGAIIGGAIGPCFIKKINPGFLRKAIGILGLISGIWILL